MLKDFCRIAIEHSGRLHTNPRENCTNLSDPPMNTHAWILHLIALGLGLSGSASGLGQSTLPGPDEVGLALDTRDGGLLLEHDAELARWPLTVGFRVRLFSAAGYSIFVASETKASPAHWEIFSEGGRLTLYAPGMQPDHVRTGVDLGDGAWRAIQVAMTPERVRVAVDGEVVADEPVRRPAELAGLREGMAFGRLVEGGLGAAAAMDDVWIGRGSALESTGACGSTGRLVARFPFEDNGGGSLADMIVRERAVVWAERPQPVVEAQISPRFTPQADAADLDRIALLLAETVQRLGLTTPVEAAWRSRPALLAHWRTWSEPARVFLWNPQLHRPEGRVYDERSLFRSEDHDALGTLLRRTRALLEHRLALGGVKSIPDGVAVDLERLERADTVSRGQSWAVREGLYYAGCAVRRELMLSDPLLDFERLVCISRGTWAGTRWTCRGNGDDLGGHFATQHFGFITKPGGGLWLVSDWKRLPRLEEPLRDVPVQSGPLRGEYLGGSVHTPDLSYDGRSLLFAHNFADSNSWTWTEATTWKLFRLEIGSGVLHQLTSGAFNDFDPCWTPAGDVVFVSERRGGYIRCFHNLPVPTYVLHRMRADGSGIHPISFYETSEWNPSIDHDGRLVYARWDYTDREDCLGSTFWVSEPDGCNPRSPHGNYPYPWSTHPEADEGYRVGPRRTIMSEMGIRAIPGSRKYVCTVAPHHGEQYGAIGVIDLGGPDSGNGMDQMARVTPYQPFPESECAGRSNYQYGTPWPLSEDLFLCTSWEDLVVLDRFGNEVLVLARTEVPRAKDDPAFRLCEPIPLAPRPTPPIVPDRSRAWPDRADEGGGEPARISVMNVYDTDIPLPEGSVIRWLRVVQNFLKEDPEMDLPRIGYGDENTPRMSLGIAPVEQDGSVSFFAPPNKELIFQLLDEDFRAVHSMRSVAFVHRGEELSCAGCHEPKNRSPLMPAVFPIALRRSPSDLIPEPMGREPIAYARHIRPILERNALPCLAELEELEHAALEPFAFHLAGGFLGNIDRPGGGGSRTIPGLYGARASILGREAHAAWKASEMSDSDFRTLTLWLDCHSPRLGTFHGEAAQTAGELVWPRLDVDPTDPLGLEGDRGENGSAEIFETAEQLHPSHPGAAELWRTEAVQ